MIRLEAVTKRYDDGTVAVDNLDLDVAAGELCCLVGPSGSGKTTTMRMINRLIEPTSGRIFLDGEDVTHSDPVQLRRRMGYVIQQVGLFPHLTIADNVGTVPRLLGWDRSRIKARTSELLELVGLDPDRFAKRYPSELSGGQRQRAGVARALAADPPVLLMDEPFGAIDPITRDRLQGEFHRLQQELGKTVVFVTHDIEEAVRLGTRIAVLADGGRLEQYDTPAQILGSPATPFVAEFVGADRGLKRLTVTSIDTADLDRPPLVGPDDTMAAARLLLADARLPWAVVIDGNGALRGWIGEKDLYGDGLVGDRTHRMEAWVPADATLKQAFAEMLQHDAGWVAVLDQDGTYVGVLTPDLLHAALRRSVDRSDGVELAESPLRV
ncbi:betaine/proline/choline family ABC transporter ATP-binding protein [Acidiferrimicrobium sp. IK]|uniref:ABC transporter ATP-binding protein n=1 Tax=Acidiferrimicrobium sp. IK TaxID=2871700 RepID=UPI0021CB9018|nr:betaine/proline/choline family ABC transporter ATP-binding protein [Acidiferrimicrobium sp. IK]MCU4183069.1 betaine/proline/choline family ABC transporter ATP-binding protein [Acidiferrimicrobium sp. IK]